MTHVSVNNIGDTDKIYMCYIYVWGSFIWLMFTETLQLQRLFVLVCMEKTGASTPYTNNKLSSLYFRCLSGECTHKIIYLSCKPQSVL